MSRRATNSTWCWATGAARCFTPGSTGLRKADLQLVRWDANGRSQWIDAANAERPAAAVETGLRLPAAGPITSYFGNRYHPILHFTRFHAGIDIGAGWGSPIVAAADGQVVAAGGPEAMAARCASATPAA